jgi:hypothetical protein
MKTAATLLLVLALEGCALGRGLANIPLGLAGAQIKPKAVRADWNGAGWEALPEGERAQWREAFNVDHAQCVERGYSLQTYYSSAGWSGGTGGSAGGSRFNDGVYFSCMQARGWVADGYMLAY